MFFMFIFATEKIKEMKKTILFSILLLLTVASAWAVSYPDQGLMPSHYSEGEFFYLPGAGNFRSSEQVNKPYDPTDTQYDMWEGTWDNDTGNMSAVQAMGMSPSEYVDTYYAKGSTGYWIGPALIDGVVVGGDPTDLNGYYTEGSYSVETTLNSIYHNVYNTCVGKGGETLACQNYAIDVYNLALSNYEYHTGSYAVFVGYLTVPVSTDIAFMALMLAAYLGFAAYRKKHFLAKA